MERQKKPPLSIKVFPNSKGNMIILPGTIKKRIKIPLNGKQTCYFF